MEVRGESGTISLLSLLTRDLLFSIELAHHCLSVVSCQLSLNEVPKLLPPKLHHLLHSIKAEVTSAIKFTNTLLFQCNDNLFSFQS